MLDFQKERAVLLAELGTDPEQGMKSADVGQSAEKHGINALTRAKPVPMYKRIWEASSEPMIVMLIIAAFIALGVNITLHFTGDEADFLECVGIFVAIALSVIITVVMEGKSAKAFEALNRINENVVIKVIRDGQANQINQKDIVVGDILILATGDRIPADGRLLESMDLAADESALTGESIPAEKEAGAVIAEAKTPVAERRNMLYSGTYVTGGFCKMLVTAVGDATEFGKIARELSVNGKVTTPLQEKLGRLSKIITIFGVIAASVVFVSQLVSFALHGNLTFGGVMDAFIVSIVLIVAAVPEGLPTIVAVSLSINTIKLSKQNALVKKLIASETVGCVNVICSDKTGTLTENKMVTEAVWDGGILAPDQLENPFLIENFCINSTADVGEGNCCFIGNPTECALLNTVAAAGGDYRKLRHEVKVLHVFPFSSEEKHMTTVVRRGDAAICYTKGAPERIFAMCSLSGEQRAEIDQLVEQYQRKACRVLAFSHKEVAAAANYEEIHNSIEHDMVLDGFVAISDPLRSDVFEAVQDCRRAGVALKILTGDNIITATAIANELGVLGENAIAVEAAQLEALSDEELSAKLDTVAVIARSTPTVKMRVVKLLKAKGNVVAVTGDGINDAPALKNADVGIAMGISGTEVSKEASDIVLLNDSFSTIVRAIQWGRGIYENFKRFISFQLTVNVSSVIVVLVSILLGMDAPFTALQLLWINIIMDGPPALTLGLEPISDDLMEQPPVKRSANILSKPFLIRIGLTGLYISIVFLTQYIVNFLGATREQMPTVMFTLFALFQLFNAFNCRELHTASIFGTLLKNRLMLVVVGITFVLQVLIIQYAGAFFNTVPLPVDMWLKLFGVAFSVIIVSELGRLICRMARH